MADPLVVDLPHKLGRAEARRRIAERVGGMGEFMPGGMAKVTSSWPGEDRMAFEVVALGQTVSGTADIGDTLVRLTLVLPGMLVLAARPIAEAIRGRGAELLLGDGSKA